MKLKTCPFCGSCDVDILETKSGVAGLTGEYVVACYCCYAQSGEQTTRTLARAAWNKRPQPAKKGTKQ